MWLQQGGLLGSLGSASSEEIPFLWLIDTWGRPWLHGRCHVQFGVQAKSVEGERNGEKMGGSNWAFTGSVRAWWTRGWVRGKHKRHKWEYVHGSTVLLAKNGNKCASWFLMFVFTMATPKRTYWFILYFLTRLHNTGPRCAVLKHGHQTDVHIFVYACSALHLLWKNMAQKRQRGNKDGASRWDRSPWRDGRHGQMWYCLNGQRWRDI